MEAAFSRFLKDPAEFNAARDLTLPEDKQAFPKLVLLDTLHWIEGAKREDLSPHGGNGR
jgi:hypothetical protein